ncbi:MAG: sugar transferase, partial [Bacillota bacterium]|nr:sugar transferase [Bacillota bacterium]
MILKDWDDLPDNMKNNRVWKYYKKLSKKRLSLYFKRIFDIFMASLMLIILSPIVAIVGLVIKLSSNGPVLFFQD